MSLVKEGNGLPFRIASEEFHEEVRERRRNGSRIPILRNQLIELKAKKRKNTSRFKSYDSHIKQKKRELQAEKQRVAEGVVPTDL